MKELYRAIMVVVLISLLAGSVGWYIGIEDSAYSNKEIISLYHTLLTEQNENLKLILL